MHVNGFLHSVATVLIRLSSLQHANMAAWIVALPHDLEWPSTISARTNLSDLSISQYVHVVYAHSGLVKLHHSVLLAAKKVDIYKWILQTTFL